MKILLTGGCGFIGSTLIKRFMEETDFQVLNLDSLTKISVPESLKIYQNNERYLFKLLDICNYNNLEKEFYNYEPDIVFHLAAESHVDESIKYPIKFINTNILGTFNILEITKKYLKTHEKKKKNFRFLHISTDEVYGSLKDKNNSFSEQSNYNPNSPYSASKASSDHLVRAWHKTFDLPTIITHCCNNYGPWQFPEKLIPVVITKCLNKDKIPIYGNGKHIREWIFVEDHIEVLMKILLEGEIGEVYNIGSGEEVNNNELVSLICNFFDNKHPSDNSYHSLITYVDDRPGHDFRYALNSSKIINKFNFKPKYDFKSGINRTIEWYINNSNWLFNKLNDKINL